MIWEVWFYHFGEKVRTLVQADSFDEALKIARSSDMRYNSGRVYKEELK